MGKVHAVPVPQAKLMVIPELLLKHDQVRFPDIPPTPEYGVQRTSSPMARSDKFPGGEVTVPDAEDPELTLEPSPKPLVDVVVLMMSVESCRKGEALLPPSLISAAELDPRVTEPMTSSFALGEVVPIPIFPLASIRNRSEPKVEKASILAPGLNIPTSVSLLNE